MKYKREHEFNQKRTIISVQVASIRISEQNIYAYFSQSLTSEPFQDFSESDQL